ncbi:MAG: pyridoxal phosphate-dependent class II aminotransferase [Agarilytica sp.]
MRYPDHGGDIAWAERTFGHPKSEWVDLSTGISPWSWPVPSIPTDIWRSLPPSCDVLHQCAAKYFGCDEQMLCAISGSQYFISSIPRLQIKARVCLPKVAYSEHEKNWAAHGHDVSHYESVDELIECLTHSETDYAVIVNPNNPSTEFISADQIDSCVNAIEKNNHNCTLIIDEAFIDTYPQGSYVERLQSNNVIILRSIGKFFGLAGVRLGFVIGMPSTIESLSSLSAPWSVNHPSIYIGERALNDIAWVNSQRARIAASASELSALLSGRYTCVKSAGLFVSVFDRYSSLEKEFSCFAEEGKIFLRLIALNNGKGILRFGLPGAAFDYVKTFIEQMETR